MASFQSRDSRRLCIVLYILWMFVYVPLPVHGESEVLTADNFDKIFRGQWMVKFYAPWCPACRNLRPVWEKFAIKAEQMNARVAEVDVTKYTDLSGRFAITSLPTIYHTMNGEFRLYKDKRRLQDMVAFIENREWEKVEPIPSWKSPNSILMRLLGVVFKASVVLKDTHSLLTEIYGLPAWCSFVIFGVVTVLVGLIIGMILVFFLDFCIGKFWPAQTYEGLKPEEEDEPGEEETQEDNEIEEPSNQAENTTNVRKRGKKLKATME